MKSRISGDTKMKIAIKLAMATAALVTGTLFVVSAGLAFGNAPWCAVTTLGRGDVYWDCQYRTIEQCVPNVIAGNRGFCNLNPYGPGPTAVAVPLKRHHKRHVRHD
jgi:hypothetical protein